MCVCVCGGGGGVYGEPSPDFFFYLEGQREHLRPLFTNSASCLDYYAFLTLKTGNIHYFGNDNCTVCNEAYTGLSLNQKGNKSHVIGGSTLFFISNKQKFQ